jgi:hypothetical protein
MRSVGQRRQVIGHLLDIGWIGFEPRRLGHRLAGAERNAIKLSDPLGHDVSMLVEPGPERVEQLVHGDELRALEVPMRLLGGERQIDSVGKP